MVSAVLHSFWRLQERICVQLLEALCIPGLVAPASTFKMYHPAFSFHHHLPLSDLTLLSPFQKDFCDYTGLTWIIHDNSNIPTSSSLNSVTSSNSPLPRIVTYSKAWRLVHGYLCREKKEALFCLPQWHRSNNFVFLKMPVRQDLIQGTKVMSCLFLQVLYLKSRFSYAKCHLYIITAY